MSTSEKRAKALKIIQAADLDPADQGPLMNDIIYALQAERAAVWDMAVKAVQNLEGRYLGNWNSAVVNAIDEIRKAQAKEAQA